MRLSQREGFTLIELLIVVAIIGILAAIAVPNFLNAQLRAKIARVHADMKSLSTALEEYMLDWNSYVEDHDWPSDVTQRGLFRLTTPTPYLSSLPADPFESHSLMNAEKNPTFEFGSGNATSASKAWPNQAYLIISTGPDLVEEVTNNDQFPFGTIIPQYDMSNGLKSSGDIVRMGGQWSSGNIRVDGKWLVQ